MGSFSHWLDPLKPAYLIGFTLPDWLALLRENHWDVDARYLPRAVMATLGTAVTSCLKLVEDRIPLDPIDESTWRRPVFVLGLPRSGTTHLYQSLARDPRFAFPTRLDCYNPHTFLTLHRLGVARLLALLPREKRFMDNVTLGWLSPSEDKVAICILTRSGKRLRKVFARTHVGDDVHDESRARPGTQFPTFQSALRHFSRQLARLHGKRLLFKSPDHTFSIPQILEVFPEARFVTILREPYSQFASFAAMHASRFATWSALQGPLPVSDDFLLDYVGTGLRRYLETRNLIPAGHLAEIRYRDLVSRPAETLTRAYAAIDADVPAAVAEPTGAPYVPNRHPDLSEPLKARIRALYRPCVEAGLFDESELA